MHTHTHTHTHLDQAQRPLKLQSVCGQQNKPFFLPSISLQERVPIRIAIHQNGGIILNSINVEIVLLDDLHASNRALLARVNQIHGSETRIIIVVAVAISVAIAAADLDPEQHRIIINGVTAENALDGVVLLNGPPVREQVVVRGGVGDEAAVAPVDDVDVGVAAGTALCSIAALGRGQDLAHCVRCRIASLHLVLIARAHRAQRALRICTAATPPRCIVPTLARRAQRAVEVAGCTARTRNIRPAWT